MCGFAVILSRSDIAAADEATHLLNVMSNTVFYREPLRDWAESLLDEARLRRESFFNPAPIRQKWAEHLSGQRTWQRHLWDVLMCQICLDNDLASARGRVVP